MADQKVKIWYLKWANWYAHLDVEVRCFELLNLDQPRSEDKKFKENRWWYLNKNFNLQTSWLNKVSSSQTKNNKKSQMRHYFLKIMWDTGIPASMDNVSRAHGFNRKFQSFKISYNIKFKKEFSSERLHSIGNSEVIHHCLVASYLK